MISLFDYFVFTMDATARAIFVRILTEAAKQHASDLHLNVGMHPVMRVDGKLVTMESEEIQTEQVVRDVVMGLTNEKQQATLEQNRSLIFTLELENKLRVKVNAYYQEGQLVVSMRLLSVVATTLKDLNVPPAVERFVGLTRGMLIIGGPYGSGRTTLAMAIIEQINRTRAEHIMTIEAPIEYNLVSNKSIVDQREVGFDVPTFEAALDYVQKEDVDVLFVSDMSSPSIIRQCLEVANAGIYTIVVMDVDSSQRALEKIITNFEASEQAHIRALLADVLEGVVIQRLVPRKGGGMMGVHEVLLSNPSMKSLILSGRLAQIPLMIRTSKAEGMMSLDAQLANLVSNQEITIENAHEASIDITTLDSLVRGQ